MQFEDLVGTKPVTIEVGLAPFDYEKPNYFVTYIMFWNADGESEVFQIEKIEEDVMYGEDILDQEEIVDAWVTKWRNRSEIIGATFLVDDAIFDITEGE